MILEDLVRLGKANGLHSFEQVDRQLHFFFSSIIKIWTFQTPISSSSR